MVSTATGAFSYDPSTAVFQEELWDVYRTLRDEHPVYYDPAKREYALSRFDDVLQAANDWRSFSSMVEEADNFLPQMIYFDPPRHAALRALVSRAFTPMRVAEIEPLVRSVARSLVEGIADRGACEAQHEYAAVIPSMVIAKMIGVPEEHIEEFRTWTESFLEIQGSEDFMESLGKCYTLFGELLAERRRRPADDLMSALLVAEVDGVRLSDEELLGFCFLLVLAGNDTTSSLIGSGMVLLAAHPDQRELVVRDPSLWPGAVEEINRIEPPVQVLPRKTTRPVEFHGTTIPEGARVMLIWGSANHDEREFADPERFDVTRSITKHLSFGHGIHYCLGANLARLEARVAFEEWHTRFPDYEVRHPRRLTSIWARGFAEVPVQIAH